MTALMGRPGKVSGVAVIEDFEMAWSQVSGGPPGLLFQAGSISKPVAALAALELVARGELDLDEDVNTRLTTWRVPGSHSVSLRQLLGHTAGLGVPFYPGYPQGADLPTLPQSLDGVRPAATKPVRVMAPRGRFRYSGGGYTVIQQLIADVTGQSFAQAAQGLVLGPLGMTSSTFSQPLPPVLRPCAARRDWHVYPESAAAGLWTTPEDLARFACAVAAGAAGHGPAFRPHTAALMLTPQARVPFRGEPVMLPIFGLRRPRSYGLGMFVFGDDWFGHIGGAASFFSILVASGKGGRGAVIMTAANASPFPFALLRAIGDEQGWTGLRPAAWRLLRAIGRLGKRGV